jgi:hypothetical protein
MKWRATLAVEFEIGDHEPDGRAREILRTQAAQFRDDIQRGFGLSGRTGVKPGSAKVEILAQWQAQDR